MVFVQPETVISWHRRGFRLFWTWKSGRRTGRPTIPADVRALIRTMSQANPLWGAPRIHGELRKLGIAVSQSTVAKYMARRPSPRSQTWRTFLANHVGQVMAADFFVVPTVTYRLLFVLVILAHDRRRIVHVAVTHHPTSAWTAQQLRNAFPNDACPSYLRHDRDAVFAGVAATIAAMQIQDVVTAPRSPWQNAYASHCTCGWRISQPSRNRSSQSSSTPSRWRAADVLLKHALPVRHSGGLVISNNNESTR